MTFWADRTPRERALLLGLGVSLVAWLGIAGIWQPLQVKREALTAQIARYQTATLMLANPTQVLPSDTRAIPVIITESAATFQLSIRRLQPAGDQVQVVLEDAPFDDVLLWINAFTTDNGLQLQTLDLVRRPAPGVVAATLTVTR